MSDRSFIDSNILIYSDDAAHPEKQERAIDLITRCQSQRSGVLSTQVLQEYFVNSTRKLGVDAAVARRKVELFSRLDVVETRVDDILAAIDLHRLHGFPFWDAMVLRSALKAGCRRLYSDDFQHGRRLDGLVIVNPFL